MDRESVKLLTFSIEDADGIGFETNIDANEESILHEFHLLSKEMGRLRAASGDSCKTASQ